MSTPRLAAAALLMTVFLAGEAFAQAAAESVLTHGLSSGAASSLGKTLGNALGSAAGQVGGKLGQQTSSTPPRTPAPVVRLSKSKSAAVPPAPNTGTSPSGSFVVSIQGDSSQSGCAPTAKPAENGSTNADAPATSPPTPSDNCKAAQTQDAQNHPAVVNLPAAH